MNLSSGQITTGESATIETSWLAIEHINTSMRAAATEKNWERVVECAAARHKGLLRHFDEFPVGPHNAGFYQQRLSEMLAGEQSLHALAVDARREIMRASASTNYNHRALNAYLS